MEKLIAAQILQRTLFSYITIKNNSCLFVGSDLSIFASVPPPKFSVGKWCKGKCYFLNHQIFSKLFSRNFSEPCFVRLRLAVFIEAGAKVRIISESPKDFGTFFKIFQNPFASFEECSSVEAGAKIRTFPGNFQIFRELFSRYFEPENAPCYPSGS